MANASFDAALAALRDHRKIAAPKDMRAAFADDPDRRGDGRQPHEDGEVRAEAQKHGVRTLSLISFRASASL